MRGYSGGQEKFSRAGRLYTTLARDEAVRRREEEERARRGRRVIEGEGRRLERRMQAHSRRWDVALGLSL